jgi:hypothetical protein
MDVASANTVTVDDSIFGVGDTLEVLNKGAGATTITAGSGVTLNGLSLVLSQYQGASITFLSASVALVFPTGGKSVKTEVTAFTAGGTFTVPTGVTYAIAHITGGGGGSGRGSPGAGGNSSVAFAGGTVTANGGAAVVADSNLTNNNVAAAGANNSGYGASFYGLTSGSFLSGGSFDGRNGAIITAGAAVTPAASITVTVGAGGTAGTGGAAGGSGYVWIEYQV